MNTAGREAGPGQSAAGRLEAADRAGDWAGRGEGALPFMSMTGPTPHPSRFPLNWLAYMNTGRPGMKGTVKWGKCVGRCRLQ